MKRALLAVAGAFVRGVVLIAWTVLVFLVGRGVEAQRRAEAQPAQEVAGRILNGSFRLQLDECTVGALSRTRPATRFTNWTLTPTPPEPMAAHRSKP